MADQITIDPNIYTGPDESVDWDYVGKAVKLHHESEQNANRRRGQQVFNELIAKGTPYADALREAGNAGLFYDNVEGQQQAFQRLESLKSRATPNRRAIYVPGKGIFEGNKDTGKYELTNPIEDKPKPAPIVATRKDPVSGATIRMNQDQLSDQSLLVPAKAMTTGEGKINPVALDALTGQMKALRVGRESNSIPKMSAPTNTAQVSEIIRTTKDGRRVVYDSATKKPLRYAD